MNWWNIIKSEKRHMDALADYEGMLSDGEAQRVLLAIYNKASETNNLDVYIVDPNINRLVGGGFQMVGQIDENLLSDEEVREVNMLGRRFRRGTLRPEEVDRYRELLEDGGVIIQESGGGIPTYDVPIAIGLTNQTNQKRLTINLHIMENNGRYDAFLHKRAEVGDASFMQSRAFIQEIYQFLEEIE